VLPEFPSGREKRSRCGNYVLVSWEVVSGGPPLVEKKSKEVINGSHDPFLKRRRPLGEKEVVPQGVCLHKLEDGPGYGETGVTAKLTYCLLELLK